MDTTFLTGSAAFLSAVIVFCGSVFLLLAFVLGARLAYWVTASVTLAFVFIMGAVWSYGTPLGPVGQLPDWEPVDLGTSAGQLDFGPAADYPDGDWHSADPENDAEVAQQSELEPASGDYLETQIAEGEVESFARIDDAIIQEDSALLLESGGDVYGAITYEEIEIEEGDEETPEPEGTGEPVIVVMSYDPGNPSGPARKITAGTFLVLVGHLVGLSRAERKARRERETDET
ncbi:MAG: hypothetical protein ACRDLB_15995 [Actinomycetota bacterium]